MNFPRSSAGASACWLTAWLTVVIGDISAKVFPSSPQPQPVFSWCVDQGQPPRKTPPTADLRFQITIDHPVLDMSQGFIPGTIYTVRIGSRNISTVLFDGLVIRSFVGGAPFGRFVDLPKHAHNCGDSSSAALSFASRPVSMTTVEWRADTVAKGTCIDFITYIRSHGKWTWTGTPLCKQEDCSITISDHYGIVTQETVSKSSRSCLVQSIIFQYPSQKQFFFQFQSINISGDRFNCTSEYLEIYADPDETPHRMCGSFGVHECSDLNFVSSSTFLILKTKVSQNSSFSAVYYTLDKRKGCNETLSSFEKYFTSPNFPNVYYPNLDCYWLIPVPFGWRVSLNVRVFRVQRNSSNGDCTNDYLEIYSQNTDKSNAVRLCGNISDIDHSHLEMTFDSNVTLHFHTDHAFEMQGFSITYELSDPCQNETFTSESGRLFVNSPTRTSSHQVDCYVTVLVPLGYVIELNMTPIIYSNSAVKLNKSTTNYTMYNCSSFPVIEIVERDVMLIRCVRDQNLTQNAVFISSGNRLRIRLITVDTYMQGLSVTYRALPVNQSFLNCEYGWISSDLYCYILEPEPMPWLEAEETCQSKGGHLASVANAQVQSLLEEIVKASLVYTEDVAVWIGANDRAYENCYEWSDGRPFTYSNWFLGWSQSSFYNAQPSDDGLTTQDCVEMRRLFRFASKGYGLSEGLSWNDRDCRVANPYICATLKPGVTLDPYPPDCNRSLYLSPEHRKDVITSPGYPEFYPHSVECVTVIHVTSGNRLQISFTDFILETESQCDFDHVELSEPTGRSVRRCGDWSGRLKLLRFESQGSVVHVRFVSDYSHAFRGFRAEVALDQDNDLCDDERLRPFGDYCYLLVTYPEVTWHTAHKICTELQGHLASVWSKPEQNFLIEHMKLAYTTGTFFWLGGFRKSPQHPWQWTDESVFNYTDWYPEWATAMNEALPIGRHPANAEQSCLASQWKAVKDSSGRLKYSGLYWESQICDLYGGYICKKERLVIKEDLNKTITGMSGNITSPNFPHGYANNLEYTVHVIGPSKTRILVQFRHLDLERQDDCLYDYIGFQSSPEDQMTRVCWHHSANLNRFDYVTTKNELFATFHSDYTITGAGFDATWVAVDVSSCPSYVISMAAGTLESVNFPQNYINSLECDTEVTVTRGKRIWLEFESFYVGTSNARDKNCDNDFLSVELDSNNSKIVLCGDHSSLHFLTYQNYLKLQFRSDEKETFPGYSARFKAVDRHFEETVVIDLSANSSGLLCNLNHPYSTPLSVNFTRKLVVPLGHVIQIRMSNAMILKETDGNCLRGLIEVQDKYQREPNTWRLCPLEDNAMSPDFIFVSTYNILHLTEVTSSSTQPLKFQFTYTVVKDPEFVNKTIAIADQKMGVESCFPNPCRNGGSCEEDYNEGAICRCKGHFTGIFCHLTQCQLDPCYYGTCNLTKKNFTCICDPGFGGDRCNERLTPCTSNPCGGGGRCIDNNDTFTCKCKPWWEGPRCDRRAFRIPYKPLSRRMLEEPFWLGLITVSVVLLVLGCVWCIKRKFADKLERFLAEEIERSKQNQQERNRSASIPKLGRLAIGREVVNAGTTGVGIAPVMCSPQSAPRSLLGLLGRRKQSMFSMDGNLQQHRHSEDRSFSFDGLLRKGSPKRRSQGGGGANGNAGGGGAAAEEKTKEILQSLVSPVPKLHRRMSLEEFIQLSEQKIKEVQQSGAIAKQPEPEVQETSFHSPAPKTLRKKVSFAKCVESAAEALAHQEAASATKEETEAVEEAVGQALMSLFKKPKEADAISADEINLGASVVYSSSSSSPESPARRLRNTCRKSESDSGSSSPVVVVHEPPSDVKSNDCQKKEEAEDEKTKDEVAVTIQVLSHDSPEIFPTKDSGGLGKEKGDSTAVFRCLETLTPEGLTDKLPIKSHLKVPSIQIPVPPTSIKDKRERLENSVDSKVHAIDDLVEALEKKRQNDLASPQPIQIPIFSMYEAPRLYRKASLETATLRVPEAFPRKLSMDGATPITQQPLGFALAAKTPQGIPLYQMIGSPTAISPLGPGHSPGETPGVPRPKPKPAPLQLLQRETASTPSDHQMPIITITSNMSSFDSDTDGPVKAVAGGSPCVGPFVLVSAIPTDDMSTSLSNLSSSGYSSMASPVPSRCSSNNPLCPSSENEQDPPTPRQPAFKAFTRAGFLCPPVAAVPPTRSPRVGTGDRSSPSTSSREVSPPSGKSSPSRKRSSSETTTTDGDIVEDPATTSGILEMEEPLEVPVKDPGPNPPVSPPVFPIHQKLPLPLIVVQEGSDTEGGKGVDGPFPPPTSCDSSSRSESPIGDKFPMHPMPLTDSDSLYDCASSEVPNTLSPLRPTPKRQGRRRERPHVPKHKQSPTLTVMRQNKERSLAPPTGRRISSPKRRVRPLPLKVDDDTSSDSSCSSSSPTAQDPLLSTRTYSPVSSRAGSPASRAGNHRRRPYPFLRSEPSPHSVSTRKDFTVHRPDPSSYCAIETSSPKEGLKIDRDADAPSFYRDGRTTSNNLVRRTGGGVKPHDSVESPIESSDSDPDSHATIIVPAEIHCWDEKRNPAAADSSRVLPSVGSSQSKKSEAADTNSGVGYVEPGGRLLSSDSGRTSGNETEDYGSRDEDSLV